jgi:pimeloyl-ACP methyl ester carboxylesterase
VVALSRRGHGRSDRPEAGYDLDTFVGDIRHTLDALQVERAILVGHSFAGFEISLLATRYPHRVEAIVYLDALFPPLDPEPDLSGDPVGGVLPTVPTTEDLASKEAYLAYYRRARPDWARIWCEAVEANLIEYVAVQDDGRLEFVHDDDLMNRIYADAWSHRDPPYGQVTAPTLAIVPDGDYHPSVPLDATDELQRAADRYWRDVMRPWIRQRTAAFRQAAPGARVVELDSPHHYIYIAEEDATVEAILDFLAG